jgi:hypothetical protein
MTEQATVEIVLTKEQQLEILAATGLRVKTLEVPASGDGEEVTARLPLPEWLMKRATAGGS